MAHIRIDYDGLDQNAASIAKHTASFESLSSRMKALHEQIRSGWEGDSSRAYTDMMQTYIKGADNMKDILAEFHKYAGEASMGFDHVDRTCAKMIRDAF